MIKCNLIILILFVGLLGCKGGTTDSNVTSSSGSNDSDTNNSNSNNECTSKAVHNTIFATQYKKQTVAEANSTGAWVISREGGHLFSFNSNSFIKTYELETDDLINQRQAYGKQYAHNQPIASNSDYFGFALKAPKNGCVNISNMDSLVLQFGNGTDTIGQYARSNSHLTFTVELNGGYQPGISYGDYNWTYKCSLDKTLSESSRPQQSGAHEYGLRTYEMNLDDFNCSSGSLSELKTDLEEIVIKVEGGKDSIKDSSSSNNDTMLILGFVGFSGKNLNTTTDNTSNNYNYMMIASQYKRIDNTSISDNPKIQTWEGGVVKMNDNGSFILNHVTDNSSEMVTRQAFGLEYYHNQNTPDKSHYFGVDVHMPDNQSIDISSAKNIVLQVGNGNDNSTYPNAHSNFTLLLSDNGSNNVCEKIIEVDQSSRPILNSDNSSYNGYGLRTHYISFDNMSCSIGSMSNLKKNLEKVSIYVFGGNDNQSDNSDNSSGFVNNHTFLNLGMISITE